METGLALFLFIVIIGYIIIKLYPYVYCPQCNKRVDSKPLLYKAEQTESGEQISKWVRRGKFRTIQLYGAFAVYECKCGKIFEKHTWIGNRIE